MVDSRNHADGRSVAGMLREAMSAGPMVVAPGAYDALTARLVAQHGFPAVYMTGAGTSVAHGYPDYGLLTMTEMVANAARMTGAVDIPVIADADTGYGNELNVARTVRAYARAGVAAIHIEDQTFPKRCGHLAGKEIVDRDAWLRKIRAAVECRPDASLLVIARTDARAVAGLDEAIERANAALALGADIAFVEAPQTVEEVAMIPAAVGGPCLFNLVSGGRSPVVSLRDLDGWGYRIAILPSLLITAVVAACDRTLSRLAQTRDGPSGAGADDIPGGPAALFRRVGADDWDRLRELYDSDGADG
jgi:2-methylisocitrate lyase-like PEP mutase family enzyme